MLSSQIDALRRAAQTYRDLGKHEAEQMMLDAADTIWQLRDDLQRANAENAKLRERIHELEMEGSDHFYRTAYAEDANRTLEAENAKLRTFLGGGSIVTDYWKDEDGTMHVLTTDGEHTYEYMRGGLADENAKLRELLSEIAKLVTNPYGGCLRPGCAHGCPHHLECDEELHTCFYVDRMRELGIEVK